MEFKVYYGIGWTRWIDVCPTNGNLIATGGSDKQVKIYDHREINVIKKIEGIHTGK